MDPLDLRNEQPGSYFFEIQVFRFYSGTVPAILENSVKTNPHPLPPHVAAIQRLFGSYKRVQSCCRLDGIIYNQGRLRR